MGKRVTEITKKEPDQWIPISWHHEKIIEDGNLEGWEIHPDTFLLTIPGGRVLRYDSTLVFIPDSWVDKLFKIFKKS